MAGFPVVVSALLVGCDVRAPSPGRGGAWTKLEMCFNDRSALFIFFLLANNSVARSQEGSGMTVDHRRP